MGSLRVSDVHDARPLIRWDLVERGADRGRELGVREQDTGLAVAQDEGDHGGIEPGVERVEDGAEHGHAEMRLDQRRDVGRQDRHCVAAPDPPGGERGGEPAAPGVGLGPACLRAAMDHGRPVRIDFGRTLDEGERRKGNVVGRPPRQFVIRARHGSPP